MSFNVKAEQETVAKTAHCKRCGSNTVAWRKSERRKNSKTGWYLVEVFKNLDGESITNRAWLHSNFCGENSTYGHTTTQDMILNAQRGEQDEREQRDNQREEEEAATGAMEFLAILDLPEHERRDLLAKLDRESASFKRNPPTMDYMTEFTREIAEQKHRVAKIGFIRASLGEISED